MIARFLGVILLGVFFAGSIAYAQSPPSPPHTFFGHDPEVNGVPVPNGVIVTALAPDGSDVGSAPIESGTFVIQVHSDETNSARFSVNGALTDFFPVESGGLTELTISLTTTSTPDPDPDPPPGPGPGPGPNTLPNGGNGGLAQAGSTSNVLLIVGAGMAALIAVIGRRQWSLRT